MFMCKTAQFIWPNCAELAFCGEFTVISFAQFICIQVVSLQPPPPHPALFMVITRTLSCSSSFGQFRFANHVAVSLPLSLSRFRCLSPGEGVDLTSPWELAQPMGNQRERRQQFPGGGS